MKNLPVFLSLSILLAGFGLFFFSSTVQAAPGDVEQEVFVNGNYNRHLVRIGNYIYVSNRDLVSGKFRITKIDKTTGAVVANYNTCANTADLYDLETDGTYLWVNERSNIYSGSCNVFNRPGGYSAYGLTKMDPTNGNILQRVWFTDQSRASAYDGAGFIWAGVGSKLCKIPTSGTDRADDCVTHIGVGGWGQMTESDGTYIYVNAIPAGLPPGSYIVKVRQSDKFVAGSVWYADDDQYHSVLLKGAEVWKTSRLSGGSLWKVDPVLMNTYGPYDHQLATITGEGWGQSNIASEGSCLWVGGIGQTGSLEETLSILNSSGAFIKKINVDPGTGNNKLYDVLYDAAAQKMWVSAEDLGNVYRLNASGCPSANNPPNTPTLDAPPTTWINYNPTYQATVTDPDAGDTVRAYFDFASGATSGDGSSGVTPFQSQYTPTTSDGEHLWRAKGIDAAGAESAYTSYRIVRKDTVLPLATLDQENGTSTDTSIWVNLAESDALSGVAVGDVDVRINGGSWQACDQGSCATTTADFIYIGVNGSTYEFRYRVQDVAGSWSLDFSYDGSVIVQTTGTISGYVWNDTNTPNCVLDATGEDKITVDDDGDPLVISISETGQSAEVDPISEGYVLSGVAAGTYTVCVTLPDASWVKRCPTTNGLCESNISVTAGTTTPLNFGLRHEVDSWYRGGVDGDVHTDGLIDIPVPNNEYFVTGSGVVTADDGISTGSGDPAESTWVIGNYSAIGWPSSLIDGLTAADTDMTGAVHVKVYDTDLTITTAEPNWSTYFHSSTPTIVVAPNITIASDVGDAANETINTILIAKNTFTVNPLSSPPGNQTLQIKGAVIAKTVTVNRELNNNGFPAMEVEFDPRYFLYTVPYFTQATHSWSEVR